MKILVSVVSAFVLALGLGAMAPMTATATPAAPSVVYPGTIPTNCGLRILNRPVTVGHKIRVRIRIATGGARPVGIVTTSARGDNDSWSNSIFYDQGPRDMYPSVERGEYTVTVSFTPRVGSVFKSCSNSTRVNVVRR